MGERIDEEVWRCSGRCFYVHVNTIAASGRQDTTPPHLTRTDAESSCYICKKRETSQQETAAALLPSAQPSRLLLLAVGALDACPLHGPKNPLPRVCAQVPGSSSCHTLNGTLLIVYPPL